MIHLFQKVEGVLIILAQKGTLRSATWTKKGGVGAEHTYLPRPLYYARCVSGITSVIISSQLNLIHVQANGKEKEFNSLL
jgi:hypothetical protein